MLSLLRRTASLPGDGYCHHQNNNEGCNYDGGDCCECTCDPQAQSDDWWDDDNYVGCGWGFACIDPNAPCVNDDDITVDLLDTCDTVRMSNAYCDEENNRPECSEWGSRNDGIPPD